MQELLGEEANLLERSLEAEPVIGLRVNTLKISAGEFERISPWPLDPVPWCPAGYLLAAGERPGLHPFHAAGLYYLQEPSAMAAAQALAPRPGERLLDLAAAPGGKSTHLASLLGTDGLLVANDVNGARARELSRNMERWGSKRSLVTNAHPGRLADAWGAHFDALLLDAPCSGEGMFRKTPQAVEQWTTGLVESCARTQAELLAVAARLVKPGGRLVYSTCTFEPLEDERLVARFLDAHPDWELAPTGLAGVDGGRPEWAAEFTSGPRLSLAARIWPHRSRGEGHFVALLRRSGSDRAGSGVEDARSGVVPDPRRRRRSGSEPAEAELHRAVAAWNEFVAENLTHDPFPEHEKTLRNDGLYALPSGAPSLAGVTVMRPGVWLGSAAKGRFIPSHALALALDASESERRVDLEPDDEQLAHYMLGAELDVAGSDGWLLVTVAGHPLGWGRRARGIVKNHYPKGLRRPLAG